mgnify:CR=1 FL=1
MTASPELREKLLLAHQILSSYGAFELNLGHVSVRLNEPDRYLIIGHIHHLGKSFDDLAPEHLTIMDGNGEVVEGELKPPGERFIHTEIYKARPDVISAVHSHSPSVIPFGLVGAEMQAMFHNAAFLAVGVPVFDISEKFGATDMLVSDGPRGVALAGTLGTKPVALMRAHGSVACGPSLQVAVFRAVYTEVNARIQHWAAAMSNGSSIAALNEKEGRLADVPNQTAGLRAWDLWRSQVRAQVGW